MEVLQKVLLNNRPLGPAAMLCEFGRDMILAVTQNPDAVCVASQGLRSTLPEAVMKKVKEVSLDGVMPTPANIKSGSYLLTRPLILVTLGKPSGDAKVFIDFMLSPEGQSIVKKNFVTVRTSSP